MRLAKCLALTAILALAGLCSAVRAELQIDVKTGMTFGIADSNYYPDSSTPALPLVVFALGKFDLGRRAALLVENHLDALWGTGESDTAVNAITGATSRYPTPERQYGGSNDLQTLMTFDLLGTLGVGYRNTAYFKAPGKSPGYVNDYYDVMDSTYTNVFFYRKRLRHGLMGEYTLDNDVLLIDLSSTLFLAQGILDTVTYDSNGADSLVGGRNFLDSWFHSDLRAGFKIPVVGTLISGGARLINHIDHAPEFDLYDYFWALSGDQGFLDNQFHYRIRGDFYRQEYITDAARGDPTTMGYYQSFYLRDSYRFGDGLYIKGLASLQLAKEIFKQRYEIAFRKSWRNESWIDIGYLTTMGGLFPLQGTYLRTMIRPVEQLGIGLTGKGEWEWPSDSIWPENGTRFLKAGGNAEISYRFKKPWEVYAAGDYTYYNYEIAASFPPRYSVNLGTRFFLP